MDRIVVITGASGGIGAELLKLYRAAGDTAVCISRSNPDGYAPHYAADITDETAVRTVMEAIGARFGRIDVLINNAGIGISGALELLPVHKIRQVLDVNLFGTLIVTKLALPYIGRGGKIINISSATAFFALPFRGVYCTAKAGVNMFGYSLRAELLPLGIQVSSVCPGDTKSNFTANRIKNFETTGRYGDRIQNAASGIDEKDGKRMPAAVMAAKIFKRIDKNRLKPDYLIGKKVVFLKIISRFTTRSFMLKMTDKFFGGHGGVK
ncbi:MAG: SDR family NAD(P)-dependent oxidoreductase [Clostridiales bacterium]|jgi:NAD(P)-dependent dehydrogenase (short-subunit alcohol dehydrogenase family)|nr:SDR family NAD(P)-dependent oxidoreductase [Clostridiales bacterium]